MFVLNFLLDCFYWFKMFVYVLNKKGFFKQIENDQIKKGATIKFENIELEYK